MVSEAMIFSTAFDSTSPLEAPAFHWLTGWPTESLVSAGMDRGRPRLSFDLEDGRLFDRIEEVQGDQGALVSCCLIERAASDRPPPRMLVLCGPDAVGLEDIMGKMLVDFAEAFGRTVSHTTRPPLEHEVDGDTYHFTDRPTMESDIEHDVLVLCACGGLLALLFAGPPCGNALLPVGLRAGRALTRALACLGNVGSEAAEAGLRCVEAHSAVLASLGRSVV